MSQNDGSDEERLRTAPAERFAGDSHVFDLRAALAALRAEDHSGKGGHRQITIFRRPPVTHVLFSFEPGGVLDEHSANGLVTIHVLEGRLLVQADGRDHALEGGQMLVLSPRVLHAVRAREASAMLLTVHMEAKSGGRSATPGS